MSVDQQFNSVLQKIKEIYEFLTEGKPSPDDEIEAREQLLALFNKLKTINPSSNLVGDIDKILEGLRNWDTLELWFSETSLLKEIKDVLGLPDDEKSAISLKNTIKTEPVEEQKTLEPEIDLTDIFTKVSDQFKDEIDNLKGKIEDLKKQLEKKDETLKSAIGEKKVQKITPKREVKLPPPKIRIPVIKKPISHVKSSDVVKNELSLEEEPQKPKKVALEPISKKFTAQDQELSPIPTKSPSNNTIESKEKTPELMPIPSNDIDIKSKEVPKPEEKTTKKQKRKIVPIVTEVSEEKPESPKPEKEPDKKKPSAKMEAPFISSVEVEEINSEEIRSSGTDLFNVFSSVGSKEEQKKEQSQNQSQSRLTTPPPKRKETENEVKEESKPSSFVNLSFSAEAQAKSQFTSGDELSDNKDTLYQELIALEGRRYSLEKSFKELDTLYSKGSIADTQYKDKSDNLKTKLNEITSRIYKIRRIISSL